MPELTEVEFGRKVAEGVGRVITEVWAAGGRLSCEGGGKLAMTNARRPAHRAERPRGELHHR